MLVLVSLERERADIIDQFNKATNSSGVVSGFHRGPWLRTVSHLAEMKDHEQFTPRSFYEMASRQWSRWIA
ncbi:hypothetical protein ABH995_000878 [Bradyrhizobium yuanmingense]